MAGTLADHESMVDEMEKVFRTLWKQRYPLASEYPEAYREGMELFFKAVAQGIVNHFVVNNEFILKYSDDTELKMSSERIIIKVGSTQMHMSKDRIDIT